MTQILRQSTAVDVLIGPFVDLTDGATAETGESPSVKLSKNGQTLGAKNDATTPVHDADGYYNCELDATDTNTVGTLVLTVAASANALPVKHTFQVLDEVAYDALYGTSATILTALDIGLVYEGAISTVNSQVSFDMDTAIDTNDNWIGQTAIVEDISSNDRWVTYVTDVDSVNDRLILAAAPTFTAVTGDKVRVRDLQHPSYALQNYSTATNTDIDATEANILDKVLAYFQLALRSDSAIATDRSTELAEINADETSGPGDYSNSTDSLERNNDKTHSANVTQINGTSVVGAGVTANKWRA